MYRLGRLNFIVIDTRQIFHETENLYALLNVVISQTSTL